MIDDIDKKIIGLIQGDLPVEANPFEIMAEKIGIDENEFIKRVRSLKEKGIMRRFGATLRHQEVGFNSNAMVAWNVLEDEIEEVGKLMAGFREVSHCYQRKRQKDWQYNLYTMVHGDNREDCFRIAAEMSLKAKVSEYQLLFSEKEFKKTSMEYF